MENAAYKILINSINNKIRIYSINKKKITSKLLFINKKFNIKILNKPTNLINNNNNDVIINNDVTTIKKDDIILIKIPEALINSPTLISIKKRAEDYNKRKRNKKKFT